MKSTLIRFALATGLLGMTAAAYGQKPIAASSNSVGSIEKKGELPNYGGFSFDFTMADGTGLNSVGQNYRNDLVFYFEPTWNVGARYLRSSWAKNFAIAARFTLTQELAGTDEASFGGNVNSGPHGTCPGATINGSGQFDPNSCGYANPAPNSRRADYSDIWLTFKMPRVYTIPKIDVAINPSVRMVLPSSMQSQYQTLIMGLTGSLGFARTFYNDKIRVGYSLGYTKNIHESVVPRLASTSGGTITSNLGNNSYDGNIGTSISNFYADPTRQNSVGGFNTSQAVTNVFSVGYQPLEKLSIDLLYVLVNNFTYVEPGYCDSTVNGQPHDLCAAGTAVASNSNSSLNVGTKGPNQIFWLTAGYQALDWMNVSVALITAGPTYMGNGSYRQGILSVDYSAFTTVQAGMTVTLDKLANKFRKN